MTERLEAQLSLLEEYAKRAFRGGDDKFLPEVATKLRILLVRSKHNRPLLFEVLEGCGLKISVKLDGPPGLRRTPGSNEPLPGDVITLDAYFDLQAVTIRTSTGLVSMTKRELIRGLAEQLGGTHEDWSVDEALINALRMNIHILGMKPIVMELRNSVSTTLLYGRRAIDQARKKLAGQVN